MRYALESVVAKGGGKSAYIEGYRIGGKTGTAQKAKDGKYLVNNYIMSFVSVVPANDPEAVLYLAIDNPKNTALLSSYTTTPIARRILLDIIDILKIKKRFLGSLFLQNSRILDVNLILLRRVKHISYNLIFLHNVKILNSL